MSAIAFIGTGTMGEPIARRLLHAGHRVTVHDRRTAPTDRLMADGAVVAPSPRAAATDTEIAFTCLPDEASTLLVYDGPDGLLGGYDAPRLIVDLSTSGPELAAALAERVARRGRGFVDAPVTGGAAAAAAGELTAIVAGTAATVAAARPAIDAFASKVFVVGIVPGQAQIVKLCNNVLSYTALAATSEAMVTGCRAGIDPAVMVRALNSGTGRNSATDSKIPDHVLTRRFAFGATNRISDKDLSLYLGLARRLTVATPITDLLHDMLTSWMPTREDEDMTSIARLFEGWGGVTLVPSAGQSGPDAPAGRRTPRNEPQ